MERMITTSGTRASRSRNRDIGISTRGVLRERDGLHDPEMQPLLFPVAQEVSSQLCALSAKQSAIGGCRLFQPSYSVNYATSMMAGY